MVQGIDEFVERVLPQYRQWLAGLVAIPSISGLPQYKDDLVRVVDAVADIARSLGFTTEVISDPELVPSPVLITRMEVDPAAPWLMVYNHLDVQPADEPEWKTKPFEPLLTDDYILGRGTTDDKGPALATLLPFKHLKETGQLRVNVIGVYETWEESGSEGYDRALQFGLETGLIPLPDSILASDGVFYGTHPSIDSGLRGLLKVTVSVETATKVIHSGLGGGVARNPVNILVSALAQCYDLESGRVKIPGFYDGVPQLGEQGEQELKRVAQVYSLAQFKEELGAVDTFPLKDDVELLQRIGYLPTFEIHDLPGIRGTKIPPRAEATVTMRLVGNQNPQAILENLRVYLQGIYPSIRIEADSLIPAVSTPVDNPYVQRAALACEQVFGERPLFPRSGGTIGAFIAIQQQLPGVPIVMLNMSKATDGYHAPNEKFEWKQAQQGMKAVAHYVASIGDLKTT